MRVRAASTPAWAPTCTRHTPSSGPCLDSAEAGFDLKTVSFTDPDGVAEPDPSTTQPCMVAFAAGMTAILYNKGIRPDYAAG